MVPHVLRSAPLGPFPARLSPNPAKATSQVSSRGPTRNLLLYHHRVAQLAPGTNPLLANLGEFGDPSHGTHSQSR